MDRKRIAKLVLVSSKIDRSKKDLLAKLLEHFEQTHAFSILCSAELEFYLRCPETHSTYFCLNILSQSLIDQGLPVSPITEEKGDNQFEFSFSSLTDPITLASYIIQAKTILHACASAHNFGLYDDAKPFGNQPGNGLHINLSLHDANGLNLLAKPMTGTNDDEESLYLQHMVSGLLAALPASMKYFAPKEDSYQRFLPQCNGTTTTVSWGGNNRTVALRIPATTHQNQQRHIEHRIPGMDACPFAVLGVMILAIDHGIENKLLPPSPKVYGNANDRQYATAPYHLKSLPKSLEDAMAIKSIILAPYY